MNPIDIEIGSRVRKRRLALGATQGGLGAALGVTFQQIQKYEKGKNQISVSRLLQLANFLKVPVSYFTDNLGLAGA